MDSILDWIDLERVRTQARMLNSQSKKESFGFLDESKKEFEGFIKTEIPETIPFGRELSSASSLPEIAARKMMKETRNLAQRNELLKQKPSSLPESQKDWISVNMYDEGWSEFISLLKNRLEFSSLVILNPKEKRYSSFQGHKLFDFLLKKMNFIEKISVGKPYAFILGAQKICQILPLTSKRESIILGIITPKDLSDEEINYIQKLLQ